MVSPESIQNSEELAKVIRFPAEHMVDPSDFDNKDIADAFISFLTGHPSTRGRSSDWLAEYVNRHIGKVPADELTGSELAWRQKLSGLMSTDVWSIDDDESFEELLNSDNPPLLRYIFDQTVKLTHDPVLKKSMAKERAALAVLFELRAGVVAEDFTDFDIDKKWYELVTRLSDSTGKTEL